MDTTIICKLLIILITVLLGIFVGTLKAKNRELNDYKKRCDQYLKTYENICESAVGCLHISQIDEHKAPDIYLEIYKDSYQEILNRSINGSCVFLDCVVDSQDKQAL